MVNNQVKQGLWTKDFTINFFAAFSLFVGFSSLLPILPMYVETHLNLTGSAGIPLAALTLGAVFTRSLAGWALDVYGRKIVLFIGLLVFLITATTFIAMLPAVLLFFFRFIQGTGWGLANTGFSTLAADLAPRKRLGEAIGVYTISVTAALGLGPLIGMRIIESSSFRVYFSVVSMLVVLSIILSSFIKVPVRKIEAGAE
ncbi:MAG TPA: MFS transporter, partial [Firmicutes bacterium]|nr:MFS transporter [Bacillota bacterium]